MIRQDEKDKFFMRVAMAAAELSTCKRRWVGAVLVKDNMILSTGYNGAPAGMLHCTDMHCIRESQKIRSGEKIEYCRGLHAEQNALLQCMRKQTDPAGSTLYTTTFPCVTCMKLLIQAGVKMIVYDKDFADELSKIMMRTAGVNARKFTPCTVR